MKKRTLVLLFMFFISISNTYATVTINRDWLGINESKIESINGNQDKREDDDEESETEIKNKKIDFKDKKILKKEIQKRKRYHKNLLSLYNKNFEEKYLNLITDNGVKINNLKDYYDYNYIS